MTTMESASSVGTQAVQTVVQLVDLFTFHVRRENELLLPRLMNDEGLDMVELLAEMYHALEAVKVKGALLPNDSQ
jgi:hypothetical protein